MKDKNKYGQYFTESEVADFMVSLVSHSKKSSILEPSCGQGVFLRKLNENGFENLSAYEIDEDLSNDFVYVKHESFISSPLSEKYDVIIGNPPYIRWKNLEKELKEELSNCFLWNKYFNSLCDYLFIFILKSIEQLNDDGELIFICSDYWMNTTHSMTLRNYMCAHGFFEKIYHFKEAPLFEKVNASFVIFKYIKSRERKKSIDLYTYNQKGKPTKEMMVQGSCFDYACIPQFQMNTRWIMATEEIQKELKNLELACVKSYSLFDMELCRIGDISEIGNGMVSGLDAAFKLNADDLAEVNEEEEKCIINVLKAKSLDRYVYASTDKYIYMPSGLSEETFRRVYPHFYYHFKDKRDVLDKRYKYGRDIPYWEFAFPRSKSLFERNVPKIFVPCKERISHKKYFRFCYAPSGIMPLQDVTAIVPRTICKESIEYILAYLNSQQVFDWIKYNGIVKGEIVEFSESPIASIPYLRIDWDNEVEVSLHNKIKAEVRLLMEYENDSHHNNINSYFKKLFYEKARC